MFTTAHVTRDLKAPATGIAQEFCNTLMFAAIAELPGVRADPLSTSVLCRRLQRAKIPDAV